MQHHVLTQRGMEQLRELWHWYQRNKNPRHRLRKRSIGIGGVTTAAVEGKIVQVHSEAEGDGIYNCYEKIVNATKWIDEAGSDKLVDTWINIKVYKRNDTVSWGGTRYRSIHNNNQNNEPPNVVWWEEIEYLEVLNLLENDPEETYKECLAEGDRLKIWSITDNVKNKQWVGIPMSGSFVRMAKTTQDAPADTKITANLIGNDGVEITAGLGSGIDVYCNIRGTHNLDVSLPLLKDDDDILVMNIQGKWWCLETFNVGQTWKAYCKVAAGAAATIVCYLDTDGTGIQITVNCSIAGGGNLNAAVPRLADGDMIIVSKMGDDWYGPLFNASQDCS